MVWSIFSHCVNDWFIYQPVCLFLLLLPVFRLTAQAMSGLHLFFSWRVRFRWCVYVFNPFLIDFFYVRYEASNSEAWAWWLTSVILAIIKLEQNCHDFQASLDCMVSPKPASLGCSMSPCVNLLPHSPDSDIHSGSLLPTFPVWASQASCAVSLLTTETGYPGNVSIVASDF